MGASKFNPRRCELFDVWIEKLNESRTVKYRHVLEYVKRNLSLAQELSDFKNSGYVNHVSRLCSQFDNRWRMCKKSVESFKSLNKAWLYAKAIPGLKVEYTGRPRKPFNDLNKQNKRRRVQPLRSMGSTRELSLAAEMNARNEGNEDAAKLMNEMLSTPSRSTKIREAWSTYKKTSPSAKMSEDEALSFFIEGDFSKHQWLLLRSQAKKFNTPQIYPSFQNITSARQRCIPADIVISETRSEVRLQSLLDHTVKRLIGVLNNVPESTTLELVSKWGLDGSSDHSNFKQRFENIDADDSSIFLSSMVPLQLRDKNNSSKIYWCNQRSSSTRFCRPINIQFAKETTSLTIKETEHISNQIKELIPTHEKTYTIHHVLVCTMVDGKVCGALIGIGSQSCFICRATPKQFNKINEMKCRPINDSALQFGLSPLHMHIRCMEVILHIAYRLDSKVWQAREPIDKEKVAGRKRTIQEQFRRQVGLLLDVPKHGSGTTNDGNTARKFFADPGLTASITGVDVELIKNFATILSVLASGQAINLRTFENFCMDTAKLYVEKYAWYYMPSSIHRLLIHGAKIVEEAVLPIGALSEEAQECRNKDIRHFREHRARKVSRIATNTDIFNRLLVTSDPMISSMRKQDKKVKKPLTGFAKTLVLDNEILFSSDQASGTEDMNLFN